MIVYVVVYQYFDEYHIEGVFSTEELANDVAKGCGLYYDVLDFEIDDPAYLAFFRAQQEKKARRREKT